jgi:hypothetical protein
MGKLVESCPERVDSPTASGREVLLRYGVSDRFAFQFKYWRDYSSNVDKSRSGMTYSNILLLNRRSASINLGLMPTAGFVILEKDIEGGGVYFPLLFWFKKYKPVTWYVAGGPGVGIRDITGGNNQWGWGLLTTLGISGRSENLFDLNAELTAVRQANESNGHVELIFAPSISIGLVFPR